MLFILLRTVSSAGRGTIEKGETLSCRFAAATGFGCRLAAAVQSLAGPCFDAAVQLLVTTGECWCGAGAAQRDVDAISLAVAGRSNPCFWGGGDECPGPADAVASLGADGSVVLTERRRLLRRLLLPPLVPSLWLSLLPLVSALWHEQLLPGSFVGAFVGRLFWRSFRVE